MCFHDCKQQQLSVLALIWWPNEKISSQNKSLLEQFSGFHGENFQ
jgi:hypothetical protein